MTTWTRGARGLAVPGAEPAVRRVRATTASRPRVGRRPAATTCIDLAPLAAAEGLDGGHVFEAPSLNPFMALGRPAWTRRAVVADRAAHRTSGYRELVESHLLAAATR